MIIAVDTGGTKTLIVGFTSDGEAQHIAKFPTPEDPNEYIKATHQAITAAVDEANIDAITVAVPGPVENGLLLLAKNIGENWRSLDMVGLYSQYFSSTKVFVANDADLAGLSEARSFETVPAINLYVTLSTGVGTGLAINGHLPSTLTHIEGGWMRLAFDGKTEMWEDFASGKSFYKRYGQYGSEVNDPEKWQDFARRASAGLVALIPMLGPDQVVIGGSMGTHFAKYGDFLRLEVQKVLPEFNVDKIVQAKHPEEAVIYGCYYHAIDQLAAE